jgi:2-polyprenyl-3-methyl-5-hydroxy-6-metoxy-1,4-benzoquinol methylase
MDLRERPVGAFVRHPWEVARSRFFGRLAAVSLARCPAVRALDVGSGDGWFAQQLLRWCPAVDGMVCWDIHYDEATLRTLATTAGPVQFTRMRPPERFGLLLLLDVLEHVQEDRALLQSLVRENIVPDGFVILSVPAWPVLYTKHDRRLGHVRRYTPSQCRAMIGECGLSIVQSGGLFHSLLPARFLSKLLERFIGTAQRDEASLRWRGGRLSASIVEGCLRVDNFISSAASRMGLELAGLSWWAVCKKSF